MTFPKPTHRTARQRRRTAYRKNRPSVRAQAFCRDGGRCVWPTCRTALTVALAHEHEVVWRGRGGSAVDLTNVVTLCGHCHGGIHPRVGGVVKRLTRDEHGLHFYERQPDDTWKEM